MLSLSIAHASTETPTHFTLSTAMEWALKHAPVLKQIEARKQVAELELTNSKASFLPSLDFLSTQKAGQSAGTSTWGFRATETLWSNGTNYIGWKTAAASRDALEAETKEVREKLAADLSSRWFDYSRTEALVGIQTDKANLIESQFGVMKRQFEQGLKTREDYQRIRAQLLRTRAELITLKTQREQTRVELLALVGIDVSNSAQPTPLLQPSLPPLKPNEAW